MKSAGAQIDNGYTVGRGGGGQLHFDAEVATQECGCSFGGTGQVVGQHKQGLLGLGERCGAHVRTRSKGCVFRASKLPELRISRRIFTMMIRRTAPTPGR